MPRMKKRVDDVPVSGTRSRELPETLTAGRARRTIKPNPKYMNDEMLVPTAKSSGSPDENDLSEEEYILDYDNDDPDEANLILRKPITASTPQTDGQPKRRGRPPKPKNVDAPRTEPIKNLRKEVLKKMDYKTISISKSRHLGGMQLMHDGRRKLNMTMESLDTDSGDPDDMDDMEMERRSSRSNDEGSESMNRSSKIITTATYNKNPTERTILDRRGSGANKSSNDSKMTGGATTEEDDFEDDDDDEYFNDSDNKASEVEQSFPVKRPVGRPRKHPIKQISPFGGKVLLPGMKASPASTALQQSKMLKRSYGVKSLSLQNRSNDAESDDNDEEKQLKRTSTVPTMVRGPGRPPKSAYFVGGQQGKQDKIHGRPTGSSESSTVSVGNRTFPESKTTNRPTITIVNVNDIMKMKSKSSSDVRRRMEEEVDSEDVSEIEDVQSSRGDDDAAGRTNNQLVATILERKRPIPLENLQDLHKRARQADGKTQMKPKRHIRNVSEILTEDSIVDFEDVLQKNIVSANKSPRMVTVGAFRGRGRPSENSQPNENYGKDGRFAQNNRLVAGKGTILGKRTSQAPRILNATMKLGDPHPRAKQAVGSGDNHYSIDLTDPDNNVKLVSSAEGSAVRRAMMAAAGGGQTTPAGQKGAVGVVKPGMTRETQRTLSSEVKKKRVTCYETWNVIHIRSIDSTVHPPSVALSMIGLGNIAANISMPSEAWTLRTVLEKRKFPAAEGDEVFCGQVHDIAVSEEDKMNYEPNRIMFRRKAPVPGRFNVQYDRTVIFRNDTYTINIDGQSCKLMAAPNRVETVEDIETLLKIVDYVDLKNGCIEVPMGNAGIMKRVVASSKDGVIL